MCARGVAAVRNRLQLPVDASALQQVHVDHEHSFQTRAELDLDFMVEPKLPAGLVLNECTGEIYGTPTETSFRQVSFLWQSSPTQDLPSPRSAPFIQYSRVDLGSPAPSSPIERIKSGGQPVQYDHIARSTSAEGSDALKGVKFSKALESPRAHWTRDKADSHSNSPRSATADGPRSTRSALRSPRSSRALAHSGDLTSRSASSASMELFVVNSGQQGIRQDPGIPTDMAEDVYGMSKGIRLQVGIGFEGERGGGSLEDDFASVCSHLPCSKPMSLPFANLCRAARWRVPGSSTQLFAATSSAQAKPFCLSPS